MNNIRRDAWKSLPCPNLDQAIEFQVGARMYAGDEVPLALDTGFVTKCPIPVKLGHVLILMARGGAAYENGSTYKIAKAEGMMTLCYVNEVVGKAFIITIEH